MQHGNTLRILLALSLSAIAWSSRPAAAAAEKFAVTAVTEKKVRELPDGPLYWRVENFPTLSQAQSAAGETALAAEVAGKAWLFTLGPKGGSTPGGSKVAEVGPVPAFSAPAYLLRINTGTGPFGAATPVHMHPGSEAFYVLAGRLTQKTPLGIVHVAAGQALPGRRPGVPMQIVSTGLDDLLALVMFVVDATAPFSSPAAFQQAHAAIR
jgi:mannose-6-phosphate isomerase-like protein (cupin superfamily)